MFQSQGWFRNVFFQPYNDRGSAKVIYSAKNSKHFLQRLDLEQRLLSHRGSVNSVDWNDSGSLLLTAGDDKCIVITDPFTYEVIVNFKTKHLTNIFCARFLPNSDNRIISCGGDGAILNLDLERLEETERNFFTCHSGRCYKLETISDEPNIFLSCSEDGTICQYDLRIDVKCIKNTDGQQRCTEHQLIDCDQPVSTIAINPSNPYQLAIATTDSMVRIVDRRKISKKKSFQKIVPEFCFTVPHLKHRAYRITSLSYSADGRDMLASYSYEGVYLFSLSKDSSATAVANDFLENAPNPPPYTQLRLKGDWQDTGPSAVPFIEDSLNTFIHQEEIETVKETLITMFNEPVFYHGLEQNWMPSSFTTASGTLRRTISIGEPRGEVGEDDEDELPRRYIDFSQDYSIEQFTSTGCFKKVECTKKLPVFDDFIPVQPIKATYRGHKNTRTLIKEATFWGNDFIMSTSDCGHVFVWNRHTCEIVMLLVANTYTVNCIRPHPSRLLLVTSGLDGVIRLFSPTRDETLFDEEFAAALAEKNESMTEHSCGTVTVSQSLIVRMISYYKKVMRV